MLVIIALISLFHDGECPDSWQEYLKSTVEQFKGKLRSYLIEKCFYNLDEFLQYNR